MAEQSQSQKPQIDLNTASLSELTQLPMVSERRAQFIIDGRPYRTKEDLLNNIPGFSEGMVQDILAGGATFGESQSQSSDDEEEGEGDDQAEDGGEGGGAKRRTSSRSRGRQSGHQGEVKSEDDGRLKQNREKGVHKGEEEPEPA